MTETVHANMSVLAKLNFQDLDARGDLFAYNFIWHYFNSRLHELEGDDLGIKGLKTLFASLSEKSKSSFQWNLIDARPLMGVAPVMKPSGPAPAAEVKR